MDDALKTRDIIYLNFETWLLFAPPYQNFWLHPWSESNILKTLIFYCRQGKGKSFMKMLRFHIIVIEPSQYMSSQINI